MNPGASTAASSRYGPSSAAGWMAPKAIARVLGISLNTCRGYVRSLLFKLGVNSQLEAVLTAQRLGLLEAHE